MRLLFIPIFCFLVLSCKVDESDLRDSTWKIYKKNSFEFGDAISFHDMIVKNDTIYLKQRKIVPRVSWDKEISLVNLARLGCIVL